MPSITMPWGKHKGVPLDKVPTGYLSWCCLNVERWDPLLKRSVEEELRKRGVEPPVRVVTTESEEVEALRQRVTYLEVELRKAQATLWLHEHGGEGRGDWKRHYRRLSMLCHPDRGGSHELMALLNEVNEAMTGG